MKNHNQTPIRFTRRGKIVFVVLACFLLGFFTAKVSQVFKFETAQKYPVAVSTSATQKATKSPQIVDGKTPASAKRLAKHLIVSRGWSRKAEWKCLEKLWNRESGWRYKADNPNSSAQGIPQILHLSPTLSPLQQIVRGTDYISERYGSPCKAWAFWQIHFWY